MSNILDPGFELTLRPMRYPEFYEMYRNAIKNTWTVEEVDFSLDVTDLKSKMSDAVSRFLRDVPQRDQEHVDRRGGRFFD